MANNEEPTEKIIVSMVLPISFSFGMTWDVFQGMSRMRVLNTNRFDNLLIKECACQEGNMKFLTTNERKMK